MLDEERPLIAGVYQNRLDGPRSGRTGSLQADPTVFYAIDTLELDKLNVRRLAAATSFWDAAQGRR